MKNGVEHPSEGVKPLSKCPRRIELVSQGLIVRGMREVIRQLLNQRYTYVIADEAHRARRRNRPKVDAGRSEVGEKADPNKLMAFLCQIVDKTKIMLLATATPVQLHPTEAWNLPSILSNGNEGALGGITKTSRCFSAYRTIQVATGEETVPADDEVEGWEFVRDPMPAATEDLPSKKSGGSCGLQRRSGSSPPKPSTGCRLPCGGCSSKASCCPSTTSASTRRCVALCASPAATWSRRSTPPPAALPAQGGGEALRGGRQRRHQPWWLPQGGVRGSRKVQRGAPEADAGPGG